MVQQVPKYRFKVRERGGFGRLFFVPYSVNVVCRFATPRKRANALLMGILEYDFRITRRPQGLHSACL